MVMMGNVIQPLDTPYLELGVARGEGGQLVVEANLTRSAGGGGLLTPFILLPSSSLFFLLLPLVQILPFVTASHILGFCRLSQGSHLNRAKINTAIDILLQT